MTRSRRASGRAARDIGQQWEGLVKAECRDLEAAGLAFVAKNWEADKVPGSEVRQEKSKPDFSGYLPGGRHVVFETKTTESKTAWAFNKLRQHQRDHLDLAHRAGCVSFVYVLDGLHRRWVITWADVLEAEELGRSSFSFGATPFAAKQKGETWLASLERREVVRRAA